MRGDPPQAAPRGPPQSVNLVRKDLDFAQTPNPQASPDEQEDNGADQLNRAAHLSVWYHLIKQTGIHFYESQ